LTNSMEKKWRLGISRNWNNTKKDKIIAKVTVKRNNMSTVETYPCPSHTHLNVSWGKPLNSCSSNRCTVSCTKTVGALLKTSSMTYQQTTAMTLCTHSLCSNVQKRSKSSLLKEALAVTGFSMG
jgi:hypothetical protein